MRKVVFPRNHFRCSLDRSPAIIYQTQTWLEDKNDQVAPWNLLIDKAVQIMSGKSGQSLPNMQQCCSIRAESRRESMQWCTPLPVPVTRTVTSVQGEEDGNLNWTIWRDFLRSLTKAKKVKIYFARTL